MTDWAESPPEPSDLARALDLPPPEAALRLLGAVVSHLGVAVRLTEVEAYAGPDDPGSHAYRRTPRSEVMYGPGGRLYVYAIYGLHVCANVVVGHDGRPGAVLLRAGQVVRGLELARERRARGGAGGPAAAGAGPSDAGLARGPGNLARTLALTLDHNGVDLGTSAARLTLPPEPPPDAGVARGPRVGLRRAADVPWRFWVTNDPTVSAYRPAAPRRPRAPA